MLIDLSLDRIKALVAQFDAYTRPTVHIAGTNGKGSVSALLTSIFKHTGLSVGRFNSPHLLHPSDSISLDGVPISRNVFSETMDEIRKTNEEHAIHASNFEVLTVCALLIFERAKVDIVLLEVGMGGRLDATNVIPDDCVLVSVITSIDLDHQAFLGPTIEAITREKAGIIRNGKHVVLATQNFEEVYGVVDEIAKGRIAPVVKAPIATEMEWNEAIDGQRPPPFSLHPFAPPPPHPVEVRIPYTLSEHEVSKETQAGNTLGKDTKYRVLLHLQGPHQLGNLSAAITVMHFLRSQAVSRLASSAASTSQHSPTFNHSGRSSVYSLLAQIDENSIRKAVHECTWPGRLSFHRPSLPSDSSSTPSSLHTEKNPAQGPLVVLVDGAHNEAAARMLSEYISSLLGSLVDTHLKSESERKPKRVHLTCILALSHSPPKTPASVLVPLLEPLLRPSQDNHSVSAISSNRNWKQFIDLKIRIAFVRFSAPEGMPWVKPVPPTTMHDTLRSSFPDIEGVGCWTASDSEDDQGPGVLQELKDALSWAAARHGDEEAESLVLIAGSLYLVADFYRLLQMQGELR